MHRRRGAQSRYTMEDDREKDGGHFQRRRETNNRQAVYSKPSHHKHVSTKCLEGAKSIATSRRV
jgi:hypothetical protein